MKKILIIALLFLPLINNKVSANVVDKDLLGFKGIHFSFTPNELTDMGFSCVDALFCEGHTEQVKGMTFLGQQVLSTKESKLGDLSPDFKVYFEERAPYTVSSIIFHVNLSGDEAARSLRESLGPSIKLMDWHHWFFKNGASISIYNPDEYYSPAKTIYYSKETTFRALSSILPKVLKPDVQKNDF